MRRGRRLARGLALAAGLLLPAGGARAHGPELTASLSGFRPSQVALAAGETLHFRRASGSQVPVTVVSDTGLFESPPLDAEGWHHRFPEPGEYAVHLRENPAATARILVGPPRPGGAAGPEEPPASHSH